MKKSLTVGMVLLSVSGLFAQETNIASNAITNAGSEAAKSGGGIGLSLIKFAEMGGVFIYPLIFISILGIAFLLERAFVFIKTKISDDKLLAMCKDNTDIKEVKNHIKDNPSRMGTIIQEVFRLSKKRNSIEELDKVLEVGLNIEISQLQKGFTMITLIISLAPMIGFLGTVSGMIEAFRSIATADQVSITMVAGGIYEALVTTEIGLIIAIVVNFFYSLFVQKIEKFTNFTIEGGENLIEKIVETKTGE